MISLKKFGGMVLATGSLSKCNCFQLRLGDEMKIGYHKVIGIILLAFIMFNCCWMLTIHPIMTMPHK
jgi:hypothetical protein